MTTLEISNPTSQKLAATLLTKELRDRYNLHPREMAKAINEQARKLNMEPSEIHHFLDENLPDLVQEYLDEIGTILEKEDHKKNS